MTSRRALARHVWAMVQTRGEAAGLVLSLQKAALGRGLAWYAVAAIAAMALIISLLLLVAFGTPPEYRALALGLVSLLLLGVAAFCAMNAGRQMNRDASLIAEFTSGIRLDLAMVNLALKGPEDADEDEEETAKREQAKAAVREAAADKAAASSTADGSNRPAGDTPAMESAAAAIKAAEPRAAAQPRTTEFEMSTAPATITPPEAMTSAPPPDVPDQRSPHG